MVLTLLSGLKTHQHQSHHGVNPFTNPSTTPQSTSLSAFSAHFTHRWMEDTDDGWQSVVVKANTRLTKHSHNSHHQQWAEPQTPCFQSLATKHKTQMVMGTKWLSEPSNTNTTLVLLMVEGQPMTCPMPSSNPNAITQMCCIH